MGCKEWLAVTIVFVGTVVVPRGVHAQTKPENAAAAQQLFDDAMALVKSGKAAAACPKLEESQTLDPGMGTQFRLAECYEATGRLASAWAVFVEVADAAKQAGRADRERDATARAAVLRPRLPRLKLVVSAATASDAGLELTRDGVPVGKALWGSALPLDPGAHVVTAKALGKASWTRTVAVREGAVTELAVVLEEAPAAPATLSAPVPITVQESAPPPSNGSVRRTVGLVVGGVGLVGLGLGAGFGARAMSKQSDAKSHCAAGNHCDAEGLALEQSGVAAGNVSTVAFVLGGAALATGVVLFLTAPSSSRVPKAEARVGVGPRGLSVTGSW